MVSCRKGPTRQAYAWQIGPFGRIPSIWQSKYKNNKFLSTDLMLAGLLQDQTFTYPNIYSFVTVP